MAKGRFARVAWVPALASKGSVRPRCVGTRVDRMAKGRFARILIGWRDGRRARVLIGRG